MEQVELSDGSYAFVMAQVALLNCEVAGMQAENQNCIRFGWSISYGAHAFQEVRKKYEAMIGCNAILAMARTE